MTTDCNDHRLMWWLNKFDWFVVSQVTLPFIIALNLSNDGYFLPLGAMETERHLLDFLNGILDGTIQVSLECSFTWRMITWSIGETFMCDFVWSQGQGGNCAYQRMSRLIYDIRVTLTVRLFIISPVSCFLSMWPLTSPSCVCTSSWCSSRLRYLAASWSASHSPWWPCSATSAVSIDPPRAMMMTASQCSLHRYHAASRPTKSLTE